MNDRFARRCVVGFACLWVLLGCTDKKATEQAAPVVSVPAKEVKIGKWGPQSTGIGKGFSVQSDGNSAIWFEAKGIGHANTVEVYFGDKKLDGMAITADVGGSAEVPPELLKAAGKYPVYLILKPQGQRVDLGVFEVTAN